MLDEIALAINPFMSLHLTYGTPSLQTSGEQNHCVQKDVEVSSLSKKSDLFCVYISILPPLHFDLDGKALYKCLYVCMYVCMIVCNLKIAWRPTKIAMASVSSLNNLQ